MYWLSRKLNLCQGWGLLGVEWSIPTLDYTDHSGDNPGVDPWLQGGGVVLKLLVSLDMDIFAKTWKYSVLDPFCPLRSDRFPGSREETGVGSQTYSFQDVRVVPEFGETHFSLFLSTPVSHFLQYPPYFPHLTWRSPTIIDSFRILKT